LPLDEPVSIGASLLTVRYTAGIEETRKEQPPFATKYLGVLYSDMVSGTRQNVALGQDQALELLLWHHTMLRERVKRFGGKVTKNRGDGFEATFATVNAALGCAAACQRELSRHNAAVGPELQVHVRMGVNGGEAPYVAGTAYGLPLILAARVMDQAQARQVLVPAHVLDTLLGTRYEFSSVGVRDLKGLAKPVELFAFHWWRDPYAARPTGPL
jgi:class 3 adenylate cyclase